MKIAIIYSTSSGITKKAAKILSNKIKAKIQLIPIEKAKTACLLKYDFIILAGSLYHGKVQGTLKRYISRNMGTLMEKPVALFMNCDEKSNTKSHLNKTFSEQLVKSSFISSNFGYEINPDEVKKLLGEFCNEALDIQIRLDLEKRFGNLREVIYEHAFSPLGGVDH